METEDEPLTATVATIISSPDESSNMKKNNNSSNYDILDSDSDDDLLQPSGLTFGKKKKEKVENNNNATTTHPPHQLTQESLLPGAGDQGSVASLSSTNVVVVASSSSEKCSKQEASSNTDDPSMDPEELEIKARKAATQIVKEQEFLHRTIPTMDSFKWYCERPKTNKRTGKNKNNTSGIKYFPCFVCNDHDNTIGVKVTKRYNTVIRYLGFYNNDKMNRQAVSADKSLQPFYEPPPAHNNKNDEDAKQQQQQSTTTTTWNAECMKIFLKTIESQKNFVQNPKNGELHLRTEELVLHMTLEAVRNRICCLESNNNKSPPTETTTEQEHDDQSVCNDDDDDEVASDDDDDDAKMDDDDDSMDDEDDVQAASSSSTTVIPPRSPPVAAAPSAVKKKLRAGDILEYCDPTSVGGRTYIQSTVLECHAVQDGVAVKTAHGHLLPRQHQARVIQRLQRGILIPVSQPVGPLCCLTQFVMDKSKNGKITDIPTMADVLAKSFKQTQNELQAFQEERGGGDDPNDDDDCEEVEDEDAENQQTDNSSHNNGQQQAEEEKTSYNNECDKDEKVASKETIEKTDSSSKCKRPAKLPPELQATGEGTGSANGIQKQPAQSTRLTRRKKRKVSMASATTTTRQDAKKRTTASLWKSKLENSLQSLKEATAGRRRRRVDHKKIQVQEDSLKMAVAVLSYLEDQPSGDGEVVTDDVSLLALAEAIEVPIERLQNYLHGNPNNLLSTRLLEEMTSKCKEWLDNHVTTSSTPPLLMESNKEN